MLKLYNVITQFGTVNNREMRKLDPNSGSKNNYRFRCRLKYSLKMRQ